MLAARFAPDTRTAVRHTAALLAGAVALIYLLFRVHRREWLGGPGPLEVGLPSGS